MTKEQLLDRLELVARDRFNGQFEVKCFGASYAVFFGPRAHPTASGEGRTLQEAGLAAMLAFEQNRAADKGEKHGPATGARS